MLLKKKVLFLSAMLALVGLVVAPTGSAAAATPHLNYGTFRIQVNLGKQPPTVPPIIDPHYAGTTKDFTLSDATHEGTFDAHFNITALNRPAYDTFTVRNETDLPMVFGYGHEDQNILPANPNRDMTELQACFNALCDTGIFFPANTLQPPVPMDVILPHTTKQFKAGMKLSPFAHAANWNGTSLTTTLYFKSLLAL